MFVLKKISQQKYKTFLKEKLSQNPKWALKALGNIYNKQTEDEKQAEVTAVENFMGFSGMDANILTSIAKQYLRKGYISNKQMDLVYKYIPRYWKQILNDCDKVMLDRQVRATYVDYIELTTLLKDYSEADHHARQLRMEIGC